MEKYCSYYQAHIKKEESWFFVAALRSFEHTAFDRTLDKATSLFEFYVPQVTEHTFVGIMEYFTELGIVSELKKLPNRLMDVSQEL